jgi:hypothetical protein
MADDLIYCVPFMYQRNYNTTVIPVPKGVPLTKSPLRRYQARAAKARTQADWMQKKAEGWLVMSALLFQDEMDISR